MPMLHFTAPNSEDTYYIVSPSVQRLEEIRSKIMAAVQRGETVPVPVIDEATGSHTIIHVNQYWEHIVFEHSPTAMPDQP